MALANRALLVLLPDGTVSGDPATEGAVATLLRAHNFAVLAHKSRTLTSAEAEEFYAEHDGTAEFASLVAAVTAGPLLAFALELPDAAGVLAGLLSSGAFSGVHVSPPADVARELKFFFPEVFPREVAFVLLKPDVEAASARKDITSALEAHGFLILVERSETLSAERARALLPHASPADLAFLASGLSCLLAVEKPFAIGELVALCGPADSRAAREAAPSSLRAVFGTDLVKNAIAVSASADEAAAQLAHAFGARAFAGAGVAERSVALLLPDATSDGKEPLALAALRARGFMVISSKEVMLSPADAQLFMPDADPTLVQYTASGKSTAICVSRAHAARALVSLVGPAGSAKPSMLSNALGAFDASTPAAACPPTAASAAALAALFPELLEMQTTLAIIKPDALAAGHADKIVARIEEAGFTVRARTSLTLPAFKAAEFYAEHKGKPFAANLCAFMSSGPCVALALCRPGAIAEWRALMGATATAKARETTAGSLRALYGTDGTRNATHGSDSEQSARRELKFFFPALSVDAQPTADEVASAVREQLEPSLIAALTALCKAKPEDPVRWLGAYLLAHNPNKPKVAQLLAPAPHPKLPTKKIVPDIKVVEALRAYFDKLDVDRSGFLDLHEFKAVELLKLGITLPELDWLKADLFSALDTNADGRVSWAEFKAALLERAADLCFDSRVSLYRQLYGQGTYAGARTAAELVASLDQHKALLAALFGDDLPALMDVFRRLDTDGSGSVTWDEFVAHIEAAFRPRAPIAHRERLEKRAPPPHAAPLSAPPPPAVHAN